MGYSRKNYQKLHKELNKLPTKVLKEWAKNAYGDNDLSKAQIIESFIDHNGGQAIDHMRDGGSVEDLLYV